MSPLDLYTVFHLNLSYSSIAVEQRAEVVRRCYWPLLDLAAELDLPLGIEASGITLEQVAAVDAGWTDALRRLVRDGPCELIGSGYCQLIGPLAPARVNAVNLRLGHEVYDRLIGQRPTIALVNEQAFSAGLVQHYLDAGYAAMVMEWNNPAHFHPRWPAALRYLPQRARGVEQESIPVIWNDAIAFQKFQRHAHGELDLPSVLEYLRRQAGQGHRAFPLYGNDVEIFDLRPGRYVTEPPVKQKEEWDRIRGLMEAVRADPTFRLVGPSRVLDHLNTEGAGQLLELQSARQPIPVKKQEKYNVTRWAVTGRDDLGINNACWRLFRALDGAPAADDSRWRQLCSLWRSDFRTHITDGRWGAYRERLSRAEQEEGTSPGEPGVQPAGPAPAWAEIAREGVYLTVDLDRTRVRLNCRRGLAVDRLWFDGQDGWCCGTLPHGYYDDITLGADYYTGHLVLERPGRPKVTDLEPTEPTVHGDDDRVVITGEVDTLAGRMRKIVTLYRGRAGIRIQYHLGRWAAAPLGSLRLGHLTLNPAAFDRASLFFRTENGGRPETFFPGPDEVEHGAAVSFLVSASHALGMTGGAVEMGDARRSLVMTLDPGSEALIGLVTLRAAADSYFFRLALSARELDETARPNDGGNGNDKYFFGKQLVGVMIEPGPERRSVTLADPG